MSPSKERHLSTPIVSNSEEELRDLYGKILEHQREKTGLDEPTHWNGFYSCMPLGESPDFYKGVFSAALSISDQADIWHKLEQLVPDKKENTLDCFANMTGCLAEFAIKRYLQSIDGDISLDGITLDNELYNESCKKEDEQKRVKNAGQDLDEIMRKRRKD